MSTKQEAGVFGQMMDYPLTLSSLLERARGVIRHREILTKEASGQIHRYRYEDCYKRICKLGNALLRLGVHKGDRIGTFAWNNYQHLELYFSVPCIGAIIHTLNIRLSTDQLAYIANHAEDKMIFVDASLVPLLEKVAPELLSVKYYVIIGAPAQFKTSLAPVLHYEDLLAQEKEFLDWPILDERAAAGLCYTSGTTGNPKGALYSHRSQLLHAMAISTSDALGLRSSDTVMAVVPMFHANAWGLPYGCAWVGAQLVLPGPHLKPQDLAQMIQDCRVTVAAGVPTLWLGLYQELKSGKYDLSSLRVLVVGGAAMPRSLIQAFEEELKIPVVHAWGMTEISPLGTSTGLMETQKDLTPVQRWDRKARQGFATPGIDMRIVGDDGKELPWDNQAFGELQVKGPWVISSYYKDPTGDSQFTSDGWFRTGDVAKIDSDGSMAIMDRTKDLIKSGGEWISSVALENALMAHPDVAEAVVIGIPDERWSERPLALIVPRAGVSPSIEELRTELSKSFIKFWIPERIQIVKDIPKTSVGKFDKKKLRQQLIERAVE